jgi:hypothetical protein
VHNNVDTQTEVDIVELQELLAAKEIFGADDMAVLEFVTEARVKDDYRSEVSLAIRPKEVGEGRFGNAGKAASRALQHWNGIRRITYFYGTKFVRRGKIRQRETKAFHQQRSGH